MKLSKTCKVPTEWLARSGYQMVPDPIPMPLILFYSNVLLCSLKPWHVGIMYPSFCSTLRPLRFFFTSFLQFQFIAINILEV